MHTLYSVEVGTTRLPVTTQQVSHGLDVLNDVSSGQLFPRFVSIVAGKPAASFTSFAVGQAIDVSGVRGKDIAVMSGTKVTLFAQKIAATGQPLAGSVHRKFVVGKGLLVPGSISGDHQGNYAMTLEVAPISPDGIVAPIIESDTVALPSDAANDRRFALGKVTLGGVVLPKVRSVQINFGISATTEGADSDLFDTESYISGIAPTITLKGIDLEWLKSTSIPRLGKAGVHADTTIYLRRRLLYGGFVPDGTAEHVKITADGLIVIDEPMDASGAAPAEVSATMHCRFDGTNDPLVINTASAIA